MPFVTFEGIDGCGKSTLMQKLAEHLHNQGIDVDVTREPGGTALSEAIRTLVLTPTADAPVARTELLLYEASRAQHVAKRIKPNLASGMWVLCDRFYDSSLAFQGGGRSIKLTEIDWLNQFATGGLKPDLTVLLDCPVEVGLARRAARKGEPDRLESEKKAFHEAVRGAFLTIARAEPGRFLVLDATHEPQVLFQDLKNHLIKKNWIKK